MSEAPTVPDQRLPTSPRAAVPDARLQTPPPVAILFGAFMARIGAGVGWVFALLVLAASSEGDDHAAAVFAAIAVLGGISFMAGVLLVAFGSIWWAVRIRHSGRHQELPKLLARGLIAWAGAIIVGIAASAGLGHIPSVGYALMTTSIALWFAGAVSLAVGSYRMRAPRSGMMRSW